MENKKCITNILALLTFVLLILTIVPNLYSASNSAFIQTDFIFIVIALMVLALFINKNLKDMLSMISAITLYFSYVLDRSFIYIIDRFVAYFQTQTLTSLKDKLSNAGYGSEDYTKLYEKINKLNDIIDKDSFGKFLDIVCIIMVVSVIVLAVISIINLLLKKDFSQTFLGKIVNKSILNNKETSQTVASVDTQNTQVQEVATEQTNTTEETQNQE